MLPCCSVPDYRELMRLAAAQRVRDDEAGRGGEGPPARAAPWAAIAGLFQEYSPRRKSAGFGVDRVVGGSRG
jgi:hypothetical protein